MVFLEYDELEPSQAYPDFRYQVMTDSWGENFKPYIDQNGIPRIGPNLELSSYIETVTEAILGSPPDDELLDLLAAQINKNYSKGDTGLLQNRLNGVMKQWVADHNLDPSFKTYQFADESQVKLVLETTTQFWESALASWGDIGMPESEERAAISALLLDLVDNNAIDDLMTDVLAGDRASAWMQIRYAMNGSEGQMPSAQIAARRFIQSDAFELYNDPTFVSFEEAGQVGVLYSKYRSLMINYENKYDPGQAGAISAQLQPAIRSVVDFFTIDVARAEELLFVDGGSIFFGDKASDNFNSKKNDDDLIIGTTGSDTINGGAGNDVIVGDTVGVSTAARSDELNGGAGNDVLYGGLDADVLNGGDGNDKLWGGGGIDQLIGGKGNDTYFLGDDASTELGGTEHPTNPSLLGGLNDDVIVEAKNGGLDTVVIQVASGDFDLKNIEKFELFGDISGNVSVKLNDFDAFALSTGDDELTLIINKLQKTPIQIKTNGGADTIHIEFEPGVDPSQVLDHKGLTARFKFSDLSADDTIDLTSIGITEIVMKRDQITEDKGFYLMAPGAKLDFMDHGKIDKTYNNSTDSWFVVKCGDDTPYGPEFIGNIDQSHFDI